MTANLLHLPLRTHNRRFGADAGACGDVPVEQSGGGDFRLNNTSNRQVGLPSATRMRRAGPLKAGGTCPRAVARRCCAMLSPVSITSMRSTMTAAANGRGRPSVFARQGIHHQGVPRTAWPAATTAPGCSSKSRHRRAASVDRATDRSQRTARAARAGNSGTVGPGGPGVPGLTNPPSRRVRLPPAPAPKQ